MNYPDMPPAAWLSIRVEWRKPATIRARINLPIRPDRLAWRVLAEGIGRDAAEAIANLKPYEMRPRIDAHAMHRRQAQ